MPRLFIAVWPDEDTVEALRAVRRKDQRGVRFVPPENWHITLRFLGETSIAEVSAALDQALLPAATAHIGPGIDAFFGRVLALPVDGLDELAAAVERVTHGLGQRAPKRFRGHLTVARFKAEAAMPEALGALVQSRFEVERIDLVRSQLRPEGVRYERIESWRVG